MSEEQTANRAQSKKDLLLEKKRAIERELRALAVKETTARRKAETKAKIILGALVLAHRREIITDLLSKAEPRDVERIKALGIL